MTIKTNILQRTAALGVVAAAFALSGCGGGTTASNSNGLITQSTYPYIYAYADNGATGAGEVSAIGAGATGDPLATDTLYFTFASANDQPNNTLSGAGPFDTGVGGYAAASVTPAAPTGSSSLFFRAQAVQGQVGNNLQDIKSASYTSPTGVTTPFVFSTGYNEGTAAGPFTAAPYITATLNLSGITASGVYQSKATITDTANHSSTTTFQTVFLKPTDAAIASSSALTVVGATPEVTYGPDASGTTVLILPAGTYNVTIDGATAIPEVLAPGTVTIAGAAPAPSLRKR